VVGGRLRPLSAARALIARLILVLASTELRRLRKTVGVTLAFVLFPRWSLVLAAGLPLWAYGYTAFLPLPAARAHVHGRKTVQLREGRSAADDGIVRHLPDSSGAFTLRQIANDYGPADWVSRRPPADANIVARGREAIGLRACGLCHYPNGKGKPENSPVAGEPVSYLMQQMADFRNGARRTAIPIRRTGSK